MVLETLIDGVEILNKSEIENFDWWVALVIITFGFAITIMLALLFCDSIGELILGLGCILTIVIASLLSRYPTGEYEYIVTISYKVSLNEFNEKYEIVKQEGKIYTIRLKE